MGDPRPLGDELGSRWPGYDQAVLGYRHYWYPVLESRKLRKRPRPLTLLGERIVLVRDRGTVYALNDRCLHRGVPLSLGRREFPGALTCCYHGWTYDLASGELVAALTDGPDSPVCGDPQLRVRTYPVEERAGLIWIYVGDEPRPPVEEDIPESLLRPDAVVEPMVDLRDGNWRYAMENAVDDAHAKCLHRYNLVFLHQAPGLRNRGAHGAAGGRQVAAPREYARIPAGRLPGPRQVAEIRLLALARRQLQVGRGHRRSHPRGRMPAGIFHVGHEVGRTSRSSCRSTKTAT